MQIGEKCIQYIIVNMLLENYSIHKYEERPFDASSFGNELTNFSLELLNVRQLEKLKVVLCKPTLMNHCHWNYKN